MFHLSYIIIVYPFLFYFYISFQCIEIPKNAILCVRVVSDQLCNSNGPRAQVQRDELVKRLAFGETVEFLQAEVFVLWETLCNHLKLKLKLYFN